MPPVEHNARLAELVLLDVLDVGRDGRLKMNSEFLAACIAAYDTDPSSLGTIVQEQILARAVSRGYAGCVDLDGLALAALELAAAEETPA